ncbi:MAG: AraC family transcriptional regulator [Clostridiaceae bacterium]|nr:AraC family transcriptional regulator [Clostridiaceae bacterium]
MTIMHQKYTTDKSNPYVINYGKMLEFPYHWHDEVEIIYVLKGSVTFIVETQTYNVQERDILIIKSGEIHRCYGGVDCDLIIIEFGHYLDNEILKTQTLIYPGAPTLLGAGNVEINTAACDKDLPNNTSSEKNLYKGLHAEIENLILQIYDENRNKRQAWDFMIKSALYRIVALLDKEFHKMARIQKNKTTTYSYNKILHEVFEYIGNNYNKNISIDDVSHIANFSKHYFNKFFKKVTNKTFARYVNDIRIEKAQTLLKSSKQNITDIAFEVGFNSIKTFNRVFKEKVGCTPSEYRKSEEQS